MGFLKTDLHTYPGPRTVARQCALKWPRPKIKLLFTCFELSTLFCNIQSTFKTLKLKSSTGNLKLS